MTSASEANGSYFENQFLRSELNPFQAFGLLPDDFMLTQHGARLHFELAVKHMSEMGDHGAMTEGPRVSGAATAQFDR